MAWGLAAVLLGAGGPSPAASRSEAVQPAPTPVTIPTERQDTSEPLRTMAARPSDAPIASRPRPARRRPVPPGTEPTPLAGDPALDPVAPGGSAVPLGTSFEGVSNLDNAALGEGFPIPPDTVGDVGPNHYVQMTNVVTKIFDKSGTLLLGPVRNNAFWSGFGGACETTNDGDPIVLHDQLADRWLVSQFALPNFPDGPFFVCVAVARTADPTGAYHRYALPFADFPDYPKFGVWPDGYFMSVNLFSARRLEYIGAELVALDRISMLSGGPANAHGFLLRDPSFTVLPSDLDGTRLPPAGAPNHFIELRPAEFFRPPAGLQVWDFTPDFVPPVDATLDGPKVVPTAAYDINLCNFDPSCIPQPETSQRVDALSERLMHRAAYRNFGTHESLVVSHTVDVARNKAGVRWHEVRRLSGSPVLYQEGTVASGRGSSVHKWMPSIAMDGQGNIAVGYSVSGERVFPSIRFSARRASDPLGTMGLGETTIRAGGGSQTGGERWGDYAAMTPDPSDDTVLWFTHEYYQSTDPTPSDPPFGKNWQTRIASILMPQLACLGRPATWVGTPGPDSFVGGGAADVALSLGGGDDVVTRGGPDRVCAGAGRDRVATGAGSDGARGQGGSDTLLGGGAGDLLVGNAGDDALKGQAGPDTLRGGPGDDVLRGGPGIDTCLPGPGSDRLISCER
ncbi:MAG TPA: calcium-binding protein [Actinomycetota bacterium]|nr:calcium-binding protein [Actinomycetota bacterium]